MGRRVGPVLVGAARLPAHGEARWREPAGEWTYGEFQLQRIAYNVRADGS